MFSPSLALVLLCFVPVLVHTSPYFVGFDPKFSPVLVVLFSPGSDCPLTLVLVMFPGLNMSLFLPKSGLLLNLGLISPA